MLAVQKSTKLIDIPVTLGITVLLLILGLAGSINLFDGIILLVCFVAYLAYLFIMAKKNPEDSGEGEEEGNTSIKKPLITALIVGLIIAFLGFMNSITLVDAAIVVTHMMMEAFDIGVGSCWVRGFDENTVRKVFGLADNLVPVAMLDLGYPAEGSSGERHRYPPLPLSGGHLPPADVL